MGLKITTDNITTTALNTISGVKISSVTYTGSTTAADPAGGETITLTGTVSCSPVSNTVTGTGTKFDQEIAVFDFITIGSEQKQVGNIESPTSLTLVGAPTGTYDNVSVTIEGTTDLWNDRFLKKYATALIKRQWGANLKKFSGIQMPGGVTLNGQQIYDEAVQEIKEMEDEMYMMGSLPSEIFVG